jgi:hypothetical protein
MVYIGQLQNPKFMDKTWAAFNVNVTCIVEGTFGIMCACAPSLHRFLGVWFRGQMRSATSSRTAKTPSSGDSAAKLSVRLERDAVMYLGAGGVGAVDVEGEYEDKTPYVVERVEPKVSTGSRKVWTRRKDKSPEGRSFYFDSSVAEPEPGEDSNDTPSGTGW